MSRKAVLFRIVQYFGGQRQRKMNPIAILALYYFMAERGIYAVFGKCPPFPDQCEPLYLCVTFDYNSCPICKCVTATSASTSTAYTETRAFSYTNARSTIHLSHITDNAGMLSSLLTKPSTNSKWTTKSVDVTSTISPDSSTRKVSTIYHSSPTGSTSFTVAVGGTFGPKAPGCTFMNCRLDCGNPPKYSKDIFGCELCKCATA